MYPGQRVVASDGYEVALYPMTTIDITQSYAGATSHRCTNIYNTGLWDVIGHTGASYQSNIYAPFSGTITVQKSSGNQRVLSSSNKVHLANGSLDYANFGWGHDNELLVQLGDTVTQGQLIGYTGTKDASSRHSHFMLGTGEWTRGNNLPLCYSPGAGGNIYYMPNPIDIDDIFYANDTSIYTYYIDGLTLNWRTWSGPIPPGPEPYSISIVPTYKSIFIPKAGADFLLTFDMAGTPYSGTWNWYPDVNINGTIIKTLEKLGVIKLQETNQMSLDLFDF